MQRRLISVQPTSFYLQATVLPFGDTPVDLWIRGKHISTHPVDGASVLVPTGGYVLPGLVDAHVHLMGDRDKTGLHVGSRELIDHNRRDFLQSGVLLLRDMGSIKRHDANRPATLGLPREDGLPPVLAAGQPLAPAGVFTGIQEPTSPSELVTHATRRAYNDGAPWVKVILDNFPPQYDAPVAGVPGMLNYGETELVAATNAVHNVGGRLAVHTFTPEGAAMAVSAGVDSIEHGWALDNRLVDQMAERGIAWTPTLGLDKLMSDMARGKLEYREANPAVERWLNDTIEQIEPLIVHAHKRGVSLLSGTDGVYPVTHEIARLQHAGLDPAVALATASSASRKALGEPGIEDGAPADLVWYANDPRNSPELLERPELILLRGKRIERTNR